MAVDWAEDRPVLDLRRPEPGVERPDRAMDCPTERNADLAPHTFLGSASLFMLDFPWLAASAYQGDDEDNEIGLWAWDYRAKRGVAGQPLGRIRGK